MATKRQRRGRKTRRHRQRGGDTASYSFGSAVAPGAPYASEVIAKPGCMAVPRFGEIPNYQPPGMGGLPGFGGGGRRRKRNVFRNFMNATRKLSKKIFRGGRYTVDVGATTGGPNPIVPVQRIACEGGMVNTAPPGAAPNPTPMRGGKRRRQHGGVGGVDSAYYSAPTAGYTNQPSTWVSSTGTPSLLQIPVEARAMNPACIKTGGGRKQRRTRRNH